MKAAKLKPAKTDDAQGGPGKIILQTPAKDAVPQRLFLQSMTALGISPALFNMTPAICAKPLLLNFNWGGDGVAAHDKAWAARDNPAPLLHA
ncbi:MAG: hypothetical protein AAF674_06555 [Pseudomonadota bacterium]